MNKLRTTTIALAGAALMAAAGTAAAHAFDEQRETAWCTGDDLVISAHDMRSPSASTTAHRIRFAAAEGAFCKIGGRLSNVRFLDADGRDMNVALTGGQTGTYVEVPVGGTREAAVYVASPRSGPRVTPAFIRFDLPGQGTLGDNVTVAWPSGLGTPVRLGVLTAPVS